jgi:hypothetical protein
MIENNKEDQKRKEMKNNGSNQTKETKYKITEVFKEMHRRHVWVSDDVQLERSRRRHISHCYSECDPRVVETATK